MGWRVNGSLLAQFKKRRGWFWWFFESRQQPFWQKWIETQSFLSSWAKGRPRSSRLHMWTSSSRAQLQRLDWGWIQCMRWPGADTMLSRESLGWWGIGSWTGYIGWGNKRRCTELSKLWGFGSSWCKCLCFLRGRSVFQREGICSLLSWRILPEGLATEDFQLSQLRIVRFHLDSKHWILEAKPKCLLLQSTGSQKD